MPNYNFFDLLDPPKNIQSKNSFRLYKLYQKNQNRSKEIKKKHIKLRKNNPETKTFKNSQLFNKNNSKYQF